MSSNRVVFHIDVNSAFVSWSAVKILSEGGRDIRLVPSVVSGDPSDRRSIVAAKSIPCKKYGINTAEPVSMAIRKCPHLVIVRGDWEWYKKCSTNFISIWQKSVFGRTLTDIKSDDAMILYFVKNISTLIRECMSDNLSNGSWAIVATPMRRHKEHNFASLIAEGIAESLGIPFYFDCAHCHSKQRVGAVFSANNIPREPNVIVFDDFVTTGSTLLAMKNLLQEHGKNPVFFAGINNKL